MKSPILATLAVVAVLSAEAATPDRAVLVSVLPGNVQRIVPRADPADASQTVYVAYADKEGRTVCGYAVPGVSTRGYCSKTMSGVIRLLVGLTPDRKVVSYSVIEANQTKGLGARLGEPAFAAQFGGRPGAALKVKKDGGDIDAITGATVTSRAVCDAIADACARIDRVEGTAPAAAPAKPAVNEGRLVLDPTKPRTALKVLPRGTVTAVARKIEGHYPAFEGRDASGRTTGFAVTGTGRGHGPDGDIAVHVLCGFNAAGRMSFTARPLPVNQLDLAHPADMGAAQGAAFNAAMQDAQAIVRRLVK